MYDHCALFCDSGCLQNETGSVLRFQVRGSWSFFLIRSFYIPAGFESYWANRISPISSTIFDLQDQGIL